jgi:hypothetical protein
VIRSGLLVVAVWAVIGAPTLCTVGVLAHECRCDVECVCDHESECEADPCGEVLLRKDDNVYSAVVTKPAATVQFSASAECSRSMRIPFPDRAPPLGVPRASDLPLLI